MSNKSTQSIMIDVRVVEKQVTHGISCYAYELIHHLVHKFNDFNFVFFFLINENSCLSKIQLPSNCKFIVMKSSWTSFIGQFELLKIIKKIKPKAFHSPSFIVPLLSNVKLIATIHDMNHVALSQNYSFVQKIYYILLARRLKKNSIILTVSQFSKNEIVKYTKINPNFIYVIYNGISPVFKSNPENMVNTIKLPERFIFALGNNKPHKNLETLVDVYCEGNFSLPLVILSNSYEKLKLIVLKNNKLSSVIFLPHLDQQIELASVYSRCELFIFPSLYEGFGFPPLEAAACGTPVLTSNVSSLPEIMEDCAFYFDPYSKEDMKIKIEAVLTCDKKLKQEKINAGIIQAKKFTWESTVKEIVTIYKKIN